MSGAHTVLDEAAVRLRKYERLLGINSVLAERFGVVVATVIDTDDKQRFKWVGAELRHAKIVNDEIVVGDPFCATEEKE